MKTKTLQSKANVPEPEKVQQVRGPYGKKDDQYKIIVVRGIEIRLPKKKVKEPKKKPFIWGHKGMITAWTSAAQSGWNIDTNPAPETSFPDAVRTLRKI